MKIFEVGVSFVNKCELSLCAVKYNRCACSCFTCVYMYVYMCAHAAWTVRPVVDKKYHNVEE